MLCGGDYLLALKDNQPTLHEMARRHLDELAPAYVSDMQSGHGRIEQRELRACDLDRDISPFPQARQLLSVTRRYRPKRGGDLSTETRYFITSLAAGERSPARQAELIRNHWAVENKNHWRRDATRWREDRSVRRKAQGARNLALLRGALLALIPLEEFDSLNAAFDHYGAKSSFATALITQATPICP